MQRPGCRSVPSGTLNTSVPARGLSGNPHTRHASDPPAGHRKVRKSAARNRPFSHEIRSDSFHRSRGRRPPSCTLNSEALRGRYRARVRPALRTTCAMECGPRPDTRLCIPGTSPQPPSSFRSCTDRIREADPPVESPGGSRRPKSRGSSTLPEHPKSGTPPSPISVYQKRPSFARYGTLRIVETPQSARQNIGTHLSRGNGDGSQPEPIHAIEPAPSVEHAQAVA